MKVCRPARLDSMSFHEVQSHGIGQGQVLVGVLPQELRRRFLFSLPDHLFEELEAAFATHPSGSDKILDDEHRNRMVHGNDQGSFDSGFCVDTVTAGLALEGESVFLEYLNELLVADWGEPGQAT